MKVVNVIKNGTLSQNTSIACLVDTTQLIQNSQTITVACMQIGGTISITLSWSPDGKNFVAQAAAATGDVANITSGNLAWDNFVLPGLAQTVLITVTEENVGAITQLDLDLICR